jgi:hypothetical protein
MTATVAREFSQAVLTDAGERMHGTAMLVEGYRRERRVVCVAVVDADPKEDSAGGHRGAGHGALPARSAHDADVEDAGAAVRRAYQSQLDVTAAGGVGRLLVPEHRQPPSAEVKVAGPRVRQVVRRRRPGRQTSQTAVGPEHESPDGVTVLAPRERDGIAPLRRRRLRRAGRADGGDGLFCAAVEAQPEMSQPCPRSTQRTESWRQRE